MDLKKFQPSNKNYCKPIASSNGGRNAHKQKITNPAQSIWFDRKTIQEHLAKTEEKKKGTKIYFGAFVEDNVGENSEVKDSRELKEELTVIWGASHNNEGPAVKVLPVNEGKLYPPKCR